MYVLIRVWNVKFMLRTKQKFLIRYLLPFLNPNMASRAINS